MQSHTFVTLYNYNRSIHKTHCRIFCNVYAE